MSSIRRIAAITNTLSPVNKVSRSELDPLSFLHRSARLFPQRVAVKQHLPTLPSLTYTQFYERVCQLAHALKELNLKPGSRIAYLCPNTLPLFEGHFGVLAAGHVIVTINTRLTETEILYILEHSGASLLIVSWELHEKVAHLKTRYRIIFCGTVDGRDQYEEWLRSPKSHSGWTNLPSCEDEESLATICYTSGTTGKPKGVMMTRRGHYLAALANIIHSQLNEYSVFLWTLPLFHCNGWCFPWAIIATGGCNILLEKVDYGVIWKHLVNDGVTHYNGAPTVQIGIVNHPDAKKLDKPLKVTVAGSPPTPALISKMQSLNLQPVHVYGLTETYGPSTVCQPQEEWLTLPPEKVSKLIARQGQGYITNEQLRVVDENMIDVPKDGVTSGEVVFRGNLVMKGYYNDEDATLKAFKGGWFHSGDIAVWHPDGYIDLRDRSKDIIISGGENISTIELENHLSQYPSIMECAVIGIPDEKWGERPKAFVVLKPGIASSTTLINEIFQWCREGLAGFKQPKVVECVTELPKTSTGKVQKYVLKNKEWKNLGKRIN